MTELFQTTIKHFDIVWFFIVVNSIVLFDLVLQRNQLHEQIDLIFHMIEQKSGKFTEEEFEEVNETLRECSRSPTLEFIRRYVFWRD